jgi:hypothetical protein
MADHKSQQRAAESADELAGALEALSHDDADKHAETIESIVPGQIEQGAQSGETPAGDPIPRRRPTSDALDDLAACEAPLADQASRPVRPPIPGATPTSKRPLRPPAPGMRAVTVVASKAPRPSLHAPRPEFPTLARDQDDLRKGTQATVEQAPPPRPERPEAPIAETKLVEDVPSQEPAPLELTEVIKVETAPDSSVEVPDPEDVPSAAVPSEPEIISEPPVEPPPPPPTPAPVFAPADGSFVMNDEDQDLIPELAAAMQTNAAAPADLASIGATSPATSSARRRARQRQALLDSLSVRRTLIPILLTLGLLMPALGGAWFLLPAESPFKQSGSELPLAMLGIGPVFLVVAILNMLQVRSALARLR